MSSARDECETPSFSLKVVVRRSCTSSSASSPRNASKLQPPGRFEQDCNLPSEVCHVMLEADAGSIINPQPSPDTNCKCKAQCAQQGAAALVACHACTRC